MKLQFGIADHCDASGVPLHAHFENRLRMIEAYDRAGFRGYHVAEHHGTPLGCAPSPSVYLAAIAQRTRRLRFGPLVYLLPLYHPVRLIEEICMLDQMSAGRMMLGVGRGVSPIEFGFYGADLDEAKDRFGEAFECLMRGFQSDVLRFDGKFYRFEATPMTLQPYQKPYPELWYGVLNPDSVVWAAAHDVNIVTPGPGFHVRKITDRYRAEWAKLGKAADTIPLMGLGRHVVVAETDDEAQAIARRAYPRWRNALVKLWIEHNVPITGIGPVYPEDFDAVMKVGSLFAGSPETVRALVAEHVDQSGANYFVSWMAFGDMDVAEVTRSVELFAAEIMPAFASEAVAA